MDEGYAFPRYLAAKRSVDDRALNRHVWQSLVGQLRQQPRPALRMLEIGAGIGTMFERMVEWGALERAEYTAIDALEENIACAAQRLPVWGAGQGLSVRAEGQGLVFTGAGPAGANLDLTFLPQAVDLYDFIRQPHPTGGWDLIAAHAFMDLVDVPATLPDLKDMLKPGGLLYLTINFDGLTILEPQMDPRLDEKIMALYHQTMDQRRLDGHRSGDSRTGRRMFSWLRQHGLEILDAGSSDWTVFARDGQYPADEAYFLHFILHFFETSLTGHPELETEPFAAWLEARRAQIERGELVYIAHQMDFLAHGAEEQRGALKR